MQKNGHTKTGAQKYRCPSCGYNSEGEAPEPSTKPALGMSISEFRKLYDIDIIVADTLKQLAPDVVYEKNDIIRLTGKRAGYPGLGSALSAAKDYYGRVNGAEVFSHPKTILKLKEEGLLT